MEAEAETFRKVKRLVAKSVGTQKRLFSSHGFFVARVGF